MTRKTSLLLGTAALLVATGAQAADMPKAPAREPVYRCDITGFIELPGTDICFKVGGHARFIAGTATDNVAGLGASNSYGWDDIGPSDFFHTTDDTFVMNAQARLNFDARTSTEYGIVRAFIEMQANDTNASTGGPFQLRHAFIQFGNWTFGKTDTLFAHGDSAPSVTEFIGHIGDPYGRSVQVRYTMPLGNGMTLAIALEDPAFNQSGEYFNNLIGGTIGLIQERDEMPAIVAALAFDGSWGSAQIAAGVRQNVYAQAPLGTAVSDREIGWRIDAGANINLTSSVVLLARAYYSDGFNAHSSLAIGDVITDITGTLILDNVEEWMVMGGVNFTFSPTLGFELSAAYAEAEPGSSPIPIPTSWLGVDVFQVVGDVYWTPVKNLEFIVEAAYTDVNYGIVNAFAPGIDFDAFSVAFQATRKF
ncbi:MAG: porin [Rhodobiaceae bacterium]|nr:porin [Rhodobiaceae bacterium]MCC0055072.1 porin [Rhodobiaceae bacterium]